jgi:hypothetical protein
MTAQQVAGTDAQIESPIAAIGFAAGLWLLDTLFHPWVAQLPSVRWLSFGQALTRFITKRKER